MRDFPAALPHGPVEEVFPDLYFVRGSFKMPRVGTIGRNMTVLRHGGELTVVNAVRLDRDGEAALGALGAVKHVVKIGNFHGADDPYFVDRYGAKLWALEGHTHALGLTTHEIYSEEGPFPVPGVRVMRFRAARKPEAILHVDRAGGVIITCDSVQNWTDFERCSWHMGLIVRVAGMYGPARLGPAGIKMMEDRRGPTLEADYRRLLADYPFAHLLPAHGAVRRDDAHARLTETVDKKYRR